MEITKDTPLKIKRNACILKIKEIITNVGPWNVNVKSLSEKFQVTWPAVDGWFKNILRNMPEETVNDLRIRFETSFQKAMEHIERQLVDPTTAPEDRDKAIKNMNLTVMNYTKFLEEWNRKEKVAEKKEIEISTSEMNARLEKDKEEFKALPVAMQDKFLRLMRDDGR